MGYKLGQAMQGFNELTLGGNVQAPVASSSVSAASQGPVLPVVSPN